MNDGSKMISFTPEKLLKFKKAYERAKENAVNENIESFSFEGNQYLINYAKYLIEYLESGLS